jgi:uncharacterized protein (DUF1684 family)
VDVHDVVDWRRRVFALYAAVRDDPDPASAHATWRRGRDELFAGHPASPLRPEQRAGFSGLAVAPYDTAWRVEAQVRPAATPAAGGPGDAPSCAYDPAWARPLAPAGNRVDVVVPVGELHS